jgi:hypothetical protein
MKLSNKEYKKLEDLVYNYKTKNKEGFLFTEEKELLKQFPNINMDKYFDVLKGITCVMDGENIVTYHCDILNALVCGLENRKQTIEEFD